MIDKQKFIVQKPSNYNNDFFKSKKFYNIELLRILAMLMIVAHHCCIYGVFNYWHNNTTLCCNINNILVGIIFIGGKLGVDIFVLITGYFMITSKCKTTKVVRLYLKTLIYSLLLLICAYIYGEHQVPLKILNSSLFPFGGNAYWFITTYLMLYILIPYLNKFILTTKKSMLNSLMIVTTLFWCIIPTFTPANYCFSNLVWFIYLYFVGASIRQNTFASVFNNKQLFKILFILSCSILTIYIFIICLNKQIDLWNTTKLARMQTIFILSISIAIFHYFKDLSVSCNKLINYISPSVLGIYLFHDNNIVRPFLWHRIFHPYVFMDKYYMVCNLLIIVITVFVCSIIIDKIIMFLFTKPIDMFVDLIQKIDAFKRKKLYKLIINSIHKI